MISYLNYDLSKKLRPTEEQIHEKKQKIRERLEKIKEGTPALYNKRGLYQNDSNNELMERRGIRKLSEAYYAAPDRNHLRATQVWAPFDAVKNARKRRSKKRKISNRPTKNVKHKETPPKS